MTITRGNHSLQGFRVGLTTDATVDQLREDDAVLGGNSPLTTAAVLGGQGVYLARLFDLFNSEAKQCNSSYLQLKFSAELNGRFEEIALIGKLKRYPLDTLKIKVRQSLPTQKGMFRYWELAGYLAHSGSLFTPATASYNPVECEKEVRSIAYQALLQKAKGCCNG